LNHKLSDLAHLAEIVSGIAIVITIVLLIVEVRSNSELLQRQFELERVDRSAIFDSQYLPGILEKIKSVDGVGRAVQAYMDRYDLTYVEADRWVRYMRQQWQAHEADFRFGETAHLEDTIPALMSFPDQVLFYEVTRSNMDPAFVQFVDQFERLELTESVQ